MIIFGSTSPILVDINLFIQVGLITMLLFGIYKRKPFLFHGKVMAISTLVNLITIIGVMIPSLIVNWNSFFSLPTPPGPSIILIHSLVGLIAIAFAILFTSRFLLALKNSEPLLCGKRRTMWVTAILWLYSFGGGLAFYIFYYL
ncbi:MAG: conserved membrane protein of unknown function [Candidatus Thorarchaeota archaeon]|nr:MAG: conserved membrane protein of unknown function [Candidatus Thorarchaeota archaeon]